MHPEMAVAKRSITRSMCPIDRVISTSDRERRSPSRSLVTTQPWRSGCASVQFPPMGWRLARRPYRIAGLPRLRFVCNLKLTPRTHACRGAARHLRRARSVPWPLLALPRRCRARADRWADKPKRRCSIYSFACSVARLRRPPSGSCASLSKRQANVEQEQR